MVKEHKTIENILESIEKKQKDSDKKWFVVPENFDFIKARKLFFNPKVRNPEEFKFTWDGPNVEAFKDFLQNEKNFNEKKVENYITKLTNLKGKPA